LWYADYNEIKLPSINQSIKTRAADRLKILIAINRAIKKFNRD